MKKALRDSENSVFYLTYYTGNRWKFWTTEIYLKWIDGLDFLTIIVQKFSIMVEAWSHIMGYAQIILAKI